MIPSTSADVLINNPVARIANIIRTQKYMIPTVGMKAVKASEEELVELMVLGFRREKDAGTTKRGMGEDI